MLQSITGFPVFWSLLHLPDKRSPRCQHLHFRPGTRGVHNICTPARGVQPCHQLCQQNQGMWFITHCTSLCLLSFLFSSFYFLFLLFYSLSPSPFHFLSSPLISPFCLLYSYPLLLLLLSLSPLTSSVFFPPSLSSPLTESFPASPRHLQGISGDLAHLSKGAASDQGGRNS